MILKLDDYKFLKGYYEAEIEKQESNLKELHNEITKTENRLLVLGELLEQTEKDIEELTVEENG